jgi:hypothetical protein
MQISVRSAIKMKVLYKPNAVLKDCPPSTVELILCRVYRTSLVRCVTVPTTTDLSHIKPASHGVFRNSHGAQFSYKRNMLYNTTPYGS